MGLSIIEQLSEESTDLPIFNLVCAFHVINVHADLVVDVGWKFRAVGWYV